MGARSAHGDGPQRRLLGQEAQRRPDGLSPDHRACRARRGAQGGRGPDRVGSSGRSGRSLQGRRSLQRLPPRHPGHQGDRVLAEERALLRHQGPQGGQHGDRPRDAGERHPQGHGDSGDAALRHWLCILRQEPADLREVRSRRRPRSCWRRRSIRTASASSSSRRRRTNRSPARCRPTSSCRPISPRSAISMDIRVRDNAIMGDEVT